MNVLSYRSFSTELIKIAIELQDSDVRKMLADRAGKEYLEGGRLPTNGAGEGGDIGYVPELQKKAAKRGLNTMDPMATPLDRVRSQTKDPGQYQNTRDTAMTGLGGALMGTGVARMAQGFRRYQSSGSHYFSPKTYMAAAGVGASVGLADRLYRHRHELSFGQGASQPQQQKQANMNSATFSPGRELHRGHQEGGFQAKRIHLNTGTKSPL